MSLFKQLLLCLALAAAAGAGWYLYQNPQAVGLARETAGAAGPGSGASRIPGLVGGGGAVNVVTAAVETDEGGETVLALGTAKAIRSVTLFPQVTGVVAEVLFGAGEQVAAGQPLLRLEDDEQKVALDRARVTLAQANRTLERSQALAKSRTISDVALSDAETAKQLAEIEVRSAEIALQRRTVTAPFAGVTGLTDLAVGDLIGTGTEITTLDDLATLRVSFEVPERWAGQVVRGQPIAATAQAAPGREFAGYITGVDNRVDQTTRTLRLEAELANEGGMLKTGMAATVALTFNTDRRLMVPSLAVQWDRRGSFVWKAADGAVTRAKVAILRRQSGVVIVEGELQDGDKVVVEGVQRLREGAKVAEVGMRPPLAGEDASGGAPAAPAVSGAEGAASTRS
jgi:RND family efflux transporter MFP subunit